MLDKFFTFYEDRSVKTAEFDPNKAIKICFCGKCAETVKEQTEVNYKRYMELLRAQLNHLSNEEEKDFNKKWPGLGSENENANAEIKVDDIEVNDSMEIDADEIKIDATNVNDGNDSLEMNVEEIKIDTTNVDDGNGDDEKVYTTPFPQLSCAG